MPANIIRFEQLAYGMLAVEFVYSIWPFMGDRFELVFALVFSTIFTLLWVALIWVTARRRRNWGRWLYSALTPFRVARCLTWPHCCTRRLAWRQISRTS
jgi:hypothetical protein